MLQYMYPFLSRPILIDKPAQHLEQFQQLGGTELDTTGPGIRQRRDTCGVRSKTRMFHGVERDLKTGDLRRGLGVWGWTYRSWMYSMQGDKTDTELSCGTICTYPEALRNQFQDQFSRLCSEITTYEKIIIIKH